MKKVLNYINGQWREDGAAEYMDVVNPATQEVLARTPLSSASIVDEAERAAAAAYPAWRNTPPGDRIQPFFKLKMLMEDHLDELARTITLENGKIYSESVGELRRAIENVEVACGIPSMMLGDVLEDVASGVDEYMIRQPVGVVATIAPFNFPGMIPFWYLPYALACGNTYIVKPSERVPLTMQKVFELLEQCGFPPGVVNMVQGGAEAVNAILDAVASPASRCALFDPVEPEALRHARRLDRLRWWFFRRPARAPLRVDHDGALRPRGVLGRIAIGLASSR